MKMIKKPIILVATLISLVIGIFIFYPSSENSDIILEKSDDFTWSDNSKWNATIALVKMGVKDEVVIKNVKLLLDREYYKPYSSTISDDMAKHAIMTTLNSLAKFDNSNDLEGKYFLKEFKTEIKKLKNNSSDLEIKKLAEQIYNEIK
tara:strand:- start:51 stop:494 length:444 start_codon:yes stop_codon:yes gene_type:complete